MPKLERLPPSQTPLQRIETVAPGVRGWTVRADETRNIHDVRVWALSLVADNGNALLSGIEHTQEARDRAIAGHVRSLRIYALGYDTDAERAAYRGPLFRDHRCSLCGLTERDGNLDVNGEAQPRQPGKVCAFCCKRGNESNT